MIKSNVGNLLVAGSKDGSIIIWQIGDDEIVYSAKTHQDQIDCLAIVGKEKRYI